MKIQFLTIEEARELFSTPDDYAANLPLSNLQKISPENPTVEGYQKVFLDSFRDFTPIEKSDLEAHLPALARLNLTVKVIKTGRTHPLDIAQTRKDCILIPNGWMSRTVFIHEVYHVLSRAYPHLTPILARVWGFAKVGPQDILDEKYILNPDAVVCDYVIQVYEKNSASRKSVTPYLGNAFTTHLKIWNEERYIHHSLTDYGSKISDTNYHSHPEEICAEYFAISAVAEAIFGEFDRDSKQIRSFVNILIPELTRLGLLKTSLKKKAA